MDGPRTFWPSDSVLPGPPIIQHNESVLKHSDLSASIVDIQMNINQLNFRFYIHVERIQKRNESVAPSLKLKQGRSCIAISVD